MIHPSPSQSALVSALSTLRPCVADESGHLVTLASPSAAEDSTDVSILILPTHVDQAKLASLTDADIREAEAQEFRSEIERAARNYGVVITSWYGTRRETLGGRYVLGTRYRLKTRNGIDMEKSTYSAYLGSHAIHVHLFQPVDADKRLRAQLQRLLRSIVFDSDSL